MKDAEWIGMVGAAIVIGWAIGFMFGTTSTLFTSTPGGW